MDKLDQVAQDGAALETALASGGDGAIPPGPGDATPAAAGPSPDDQAKIETWAAIPKMIGSALSLALPELKEAYSTERCIAWGESMHAVAKKRGWDVGESAPELVLAMTTLGLFVLPTGMAIYARVQAKKKEAPKANEGGAIAAGAEAAATVTVEQPDAP